ncbi:MAG: IclR family transcriptional regulator [Actinobacteria bacterium]|nr:MAG: IclR family transcriptional regulator [Actinomycetota bacterium]
MEQSTGVGVFDKIDLVLSALERSPLALADLSLTTGIARPTAYRLATALEQRRYVVRDDQGRFALGPRLGELAAGGADDWLLRAAIPVLTDLRDAAGASAQLYRPRGDLRLCVASVEPTSGLRDSVPAGTLLPMNAGSAAQVLLAWSDEGRIARACRDARFTPEDLARVRKRGWAHSVAEREAGLASLSAPVHGPDGQVRAAISASGPIERIGRAVRAPMAKAVVHAGTRLSELLAGR